MRSRLALPALVAANAVSLAAIGAANVLWIDAASFAAAAAIVVTLVPRADVARRAASRYVEELHEGIRFLLGDRVLRLFLFAATVGNMLAAPIALVFLPVYAKDVVGSAPALGLCVAAYGLGGIGGAILLEPIVRWLGRTNAYLLSWVLWVAAYFAIATLPPLVVMLSILLATALSVAAPIEALIRQERTPAHLRCTCLRDVDGVTDARRADRRAQRGVPRRGARAQGGDPRRRSRQRGRRAPFVRRAAVSVQAATSAA